MNSIEIGKGINELTFGLTRKEVNDLIGDPTEKEPTEEGGEHWHYDDYEYSLSFDEGDQLTMIAVSGEGYTVKDSQLIGKAYDAVDDQLSKMNLGTADYEEFSDEGTEMSFIGFEDSNIDFWFENGELTEITFGPL